MFFRDKKNHVIQRQDVRPEYSTGTDDDLYGSPRSWSGAQWSNSSVSSEEIGTSTKFSNESTPVSLDQQPSSFHSKPYTRDTISRNESRYSKPPARRTSLLEQNERVSSAFTVQVIAALFLVGASFFVFHSTKPLAIELQGDIRSAFANDYLTALLPKQLSYDLGSSMQSTVPQTVPVNVSSVQAVFPLKGKVIRPYSLVSPDLLIEGRPGAEVVAATDGLVTSVGESQANGRYVMIDHGSFGETFYAHLGQISVHTHEYVVAGQGIGYLPKNQKDLVFGYIRGNTYRNPSVLFGEAK